MSQFEYVSVLVSIVLALGMGEVMICWARLIQHRRQVSFSALHLFWSIFVMLLMVQFWWGFWAFSVIEEWSMIRLLHILIETIALVIAALLLLPGRIIPPQLDLDAFYYDNARVFFILALLMLVSATLADILILGIPVFSGENLVRITAALALSAPILSMNKTLHRGLPFLCLPLLILFLNSV